MFSDDYLRNKIETKLSYRIAEFREDFFGKHSVAVSFKKKKREIFNLIFCSIAIELDETHFISGDCYTISKE